MKHDGGVGLMLVLVVLVLVDVGVVDSVFGPSRRKLELAGPGRVFSGMEGCCFRRSWSPAPFGEGMLSAGVGGVVDCACVFDDVVDVVYVGVVSCPEGVEGRCYLSW